MPDASRPTTTRPAARTLHACTCATRTAHIAQEGTWGAKLKLEPSKPILGLALPLPASASSEGPLLVLHADGLLRGYSATAPTNEDVQPLFQVQGASLRPPASARCGCPPGKRCAAAAPGARRAPGRAFSCALVVLREGTHVPGARAAPCCAGAAIVTPEACGAVRGALPTSNGRGGGGRVVVPACRAVQEPAAKGLPPQGVLLVTPHPSAPNTSLIIQVRRRPHTPGRALPCSSSQHTPRSRDAVSCRQQRGDAAI